MIPKEIRRVLDSLKASTNSSPAHEAIVESVGTIIARLVAEHCAKKMAGYGAMNGPVYLDAAKTLRQEFGLDEKPSEPVVGVDLASGRDYTAAFQIDPDGRATVVEILANGKSVPIAEPVCERCGYSGGGGNMGHESQPCPKCGSKDNA